MDLLSGGCFSKGIMAFEKHTSANKFQIKRKKAVGLPINNINEKKKECKSKLVEANRP